MGKTYEKISGFLHERMLRYARISSLSSKKSQYMIIELVIFFGIGVVILIGLISVFNTMAGNLSTPLQDLQIEEVANFAAAKSDDLAIAGGMSQITLAIPSAVLGSTYSIYGNGTNKIFVDTTTGRFVSIEKRTFAPITGSAKSSARNIILSYSNGTIGIKEFAVY